MDVVKVFWCLVVFFGESYAEGCVNDLTGKSAAVRLTNDLFCAYKSNVRPVMDHSTQTVVNTTMYLFNVIMNEEMDYLELSIQLLLTWKDEFLVWDSSKYDSIEYVYKESSSLWLPDIMSYDMGFGGGSTPYSFFLPESMVKINNSGVVKYNHRVSLSAQCSADLSKWPFDSHNCIMLIGSPIYNNALVNFSFPNGFYNMDYFNPSREWKVVDIKQQCLYIYLSKNKNSTSKHCILKYNINIQRFSSMYYSSVIIPAVVISLMRTFTFLMGRETSLRITLLCLFFISELMYLQFIDMKIPNNGEHLVNIVLLYRNSLMLTAMAIIISVISHELYKRGTDDFPSDCPEWLKSISTFLLNTRAVTVLTNFNTQGAELLIENNVQEDTPDSRRNEKASFWKTLSILLDRLSFVITFIISIINMIFLIP